MKHLEQMEAGQIVHEISLRDLLVSTGALLAFWANELAFTDAAYAADWIDEHTEIMATHSEMLLLLLETHHEELRKIIMKTPEGITGTVVVNPNRRHSMSDKEESIDSSKPTESGDTSNLDDIPF